MRPMVAAFEAEQMIEDKIPEMRAGDTIEVKVKVKEGERERQQAFVGVLIKAHLTPKHLNHTFTVRKISGGEGVERTFSSYADNVISIRVVRRGKVRPGRLYYIRERSGRSARIKERIVAKKIDATAAKAKKAPAKKAKATETETK